MTVERRWIKRMIETAKAEAGPLPWSRARAARRAALGRTELIRTTLKPKTQ